MRNRTDFMRRVGSELLSYVVLGVLVYAIYKTLEVLGELAVNMPTQ